LVYVYKKHAIFAILSFHSPLPTLVLNSPTNPFPPPAINSQKRCPLSPEPFFLSFELVHSEPSLPSLSEDA